MPILVRPRSHGHSFELRIKHKRLPKAVYRTFDTEEEARRVGLQALEMLDKGVVPAWLQPAEQAALKTVRDAIRAYLRACSVPRSTERLLVTIEADIGATALSAIDYAWAEQWILQMKLERQSTPGTIRKKKGALSAVFSWVLLKHRQCLASNPLLQLPHGYSAYNKRAADALAKLGKAVRTDGERNRRIDPDEEARIVAVLEARIRAAKSVEERAEAEGLSLMFQLALHTAMRMREIYTLSVGQVRVADKTVHLVATKNGDDRAVPLNSAARALLKQPWPALDAVRRGGLLLPFWNGDTDEAALERTTSRVSKLFARVFAEAGSRGLRFHDARHEAICRWVLNAPAPLTSEQLGRAAGMRDARTRQRYLSLRGSELADMLG